MYIVIDSSFWHVLWKWHRMIFQISPERWFTTKLRIWILRSFFSMTPAFWGSQKKSSDKICPHKLTMTNKKKPTTRGPAIPFLSVISSPSTQIHFAKKPQSRAILVNTIRREGVSNLQNLVGGWTNPFETYARQNGILPQFAGWK